MPLSPSTASSTVSATTSSEDEAVSGPSKRNSLKLAATALKASFVWLLQGLGGHIEAAAPGALDVAFFILPIFAVMCTPGGTFYLVLAAVWYSEEVETAPSLLQ